MDSIFGNYDAALNAFENPTEREIDGDWDEEGDEEIVEDDEPSDGFRSDAEADADALHSVYGDTEDDRGIDIDDYCGGGFYDE